jgi:hypothetical protein
MLLHRAVGSSPGTGFRIVCRELSSSCWEVLCTERLWSTSPRKVAHKGQGAPQGGEAVTVHDGCMAAEGGTQAFKAGERGQPYRQSLGVVGTPEP